MSAPAFPAAVEPARIAVVVLNYRNAAHTMACLRYVAATRTLQRLRHYRWQPRRATVAPPR